MGRLRRLGGTGGDSDLSGDFSAAVLELKKLVLGLEVLNLPLQFSDHRPELIMLLHPFFLVLLLLLFLVPLISPIDAFAYISQDRPPA